MPRDEYSIRNKRDERGIMEWSCVRVSVRDDASLSPRQEDTEKRISMDGQKSEACSKCGRCVVMIMCEMGSCVDMMLDVVLS